MLLLVFCCIVAFLFLVYTKKTHSETWVDAAEVARMNARKRQGSATISFYGQDKKDDNGIGASGAVLSKMHGLTFNGKPVYPVAVHQDDAPDFMYKVLDIRIRHGSRWRRMQGVVVDFCNRIDYPCRNRDAFGKKYMYAKNFLIDIHKVGFGAAGANDGLLPGVYKVIGEMRPAVMPRSIWARGENTSVLCRCVGMCVGRDIEWRTVKDGAC